MYEEPRTNARIRKKWNWGMWMANVPMEVKALASFIEQHQDYRTLKCEFSFKDINMRLRISRDEFEKLLKSAVKNKLVYVERRYHDSPIYSIVPFDQDCEDPNKRPEWMIERAEGIGCWRTAWIAKS